MQPSSPLRSLSSFPAIPIIAGWLLPGLGHFLIGQYKRALVFNLAIVFLFSSGLLIGSISVIDRDDQPLWFAGQIFFGPTTLILNQLNHHHQVISPKYIEDHPNFPIKPSLSRQREMGTLYSAIAGVLNLLVLLDLTTRAPAHKVMPEHLQGRIVTRDTPVTYFEQRGESEGLGEGEEERLRAEVVVESHGESPVQGDRA